MAALRERITNMTEPTTVWGIAEIAKCIGRTTRATYHLADQGVLPIKKVGGRYVGDCAKLRAFLAGDGRQS